MPHTVSQRSHTVPPSSLLICISSELRVAAAHATPQVESPRFIKLLSLMRFADATYVPPRSERLQGESAPVKVHQLVHPSMPCLVLFLGAISLSGFLLRGSCRRLRDADTPKHIAAHEDKATLCVDGFDEVDDEHMLKLFVGTSKGFIYHSSVSLSEHQLSRTHSVSQMLISGVKHSGAMSTIQLCTDTSPALSASLRAVEETFPWITTTTCASYVLSCELRELSRIPRITCIMNGVRIFLLGHSQPLTFMTACLSKLLS